MAFLTAISTTVTKQCFALRLNQPYELDKHLLVNKPEGNYWKSLFKLTRLKKLVKQTES